MPTEREVQEYYKRQMERNATPKQQVRLVDFPTALRALEELVNAHLETARRASEEIGRQFVEVSPMLPEQVMAMKQEVIAINAKREILQDVQQWLTQAQSKEGVSYGG